MREKTKICNGRIKQSINAELIEILRIKTVISIWMKVLFFPESQVCNEELENEAT